MRLPSERGCIRPAEVICKPVIAPQSLPRETDATWPESVSWLAGRPTPQRPSRREASGRTEASPSLFEFRRRSQWRGRAGITPASQNTHAVNESGNLLAEPRAVNTCLWNDGRHPFEVVADRRRVRVVRPRQAGAAETRAFGELAGEGEVAQTRRKDEEIGLQSPRVRPSARTVHWSIHQGAALASGHRPTATLDQIHDRDAGSSPTNFRKAQEYADWP